MPEISLFTAIFFGFFLGVRHSLDADHVVAVTAMVSRSRGFFRSALLGLSWGIGHTITIFGVGFMVLVFKLVIPERLILVVEFLVGIILVLLGIPLIGQIVRRGHIHWHQHKDRHHLHAHSHNEFPIHDHQHRRRSLLVGMVHGLAGSGALTVLVLATTPSVTQGLLFLLLFGAGSILGMLLFSGFISLPFRFATGFSPRLNLWLQGTAGILSIVFGLIIMGEITFGGELFLR